MNRGKFLGYVLIIVGMLFISFPSSITGAVINTGIVNSVKIILGLGFVVGGIALVISGLERLRRARMLNSRELKNIAEDMGFDLKVAREGYEVLDENGNPITVIPHHRDISSGTYHSIKKALLSGESNFRRYNPER
ncbi:hypothetical protein HYT25_00565 [Candidatus Pacearchaeota archaeon]|nr:hypothetical protein [Candidatus Pacearchaeota archaeon]